MKKKLEKKVKNSTAAEKKIKEKIKKKLY